MAIDFSQKTVTEFLPSIGRQRKFTKDEEKEIIKAMQDSYDRAPVNGETRKMFENWINVLGKRMTIRFLENKFQTYINGTGLIEIDPNYVKKGSYIGVNGTAIKSTFKDALLHEISHALRFYDDDWQNYQELGGDYSEANVQHLNDFIYKEK